MDRTDYRYNHEYRANIRATMSRFAAAFLNGDAGVIETARGLSAFVEVAEIDPVLRDAILVFVGIDSDTDALPVGDVRTLWHPEALDREDRKIEAAERRWREPAIAAAQTLVDLLRSKP